MWVEGYSDGKVVEPFPLTGLSYGLSPKQLVEGNMAFGIINPNSAEMQFLTVCDVPTDLLELEQLKGKVGKSMSFSISKNFQRKGLMLEAVSAVINHLFDIEGMDYIQCGHFSFNIPSEMLQKKLGFVYLVTQHLEYEGIGNISIENILWKGR